MLRGVFKNVGNGGDILTGYNHTMHGHAVEGRDVIK